MVIKTVDLGITGIHPVHITKMEILDLLKNNISFNV